MKKVSPEEIENLCAFTRRHYVEYYDVQTELVDHLANGIEKQWEENPDLVFQEALEKEFRKFGIFGFTEVVEERQKAMEKKYLRLLFKETQPLLIRPLILLPFILSVGICYFLLGTDLGYDALHVAILAFCIFQMIYLFKLNFLLKKKRNKKKKIFLLEQKILSMGGFSTLFLLPFYWMNISSYLEISGNQVEKVFLSLVISSLFLLSYVCLNHLPNKKDKILRNVHPEMNYIE